MMNNGFVMTEEEKTYLAKQTFSRCGISLFLVEILRVIFSSSLFGLVYLISPEFTQSELGYWVINYAPSYLIAFPFFFLLTYGLPQIARKETTKLKFGSFLMLLSMCYAIIYPCNLFGNILNNIIGNLLNRQVENDIAETMMNTQFPILIIVVGIIGPFMEELLYRKAVIDRLAVFGEKTAVLLSALLFGLCHGNFYQFFYAFGIGLVFGYVYIRTGKLRYSFFMHMTVNSLSCILTYLLERSDSEWLGKIAEEIQNTPGVISEELLNLTPERILFLVVEAISIFMMIFAVIGLIMLISRRKNIYFNPAPLELQNKHTFSLAMKTPGIIVFVGLCVIEFVRSIF